MTASSFVFCLALLGAAFAPAIAAGLCAVIIVLQLARLGFRLGTAEGCPDALTEACAQRRPIFTVHVATHDEPAEMVCATLMALSQQDYPAADFEVIVMDNNTADPRLWQPVARLSARLGPGFRFVHRMGVTGAKAGALNIALEAARPDATHVVTVDADYVTTPDFLSKAAAALARTGADYVQFPQAYTRRGDLAAGVDMELEEYFRTDAHVADGAEAVLLTGTLCVVSKAALLATGGWSGRTTTEDAELGVRLCRAGYRGRYVADGVGKGRLPLCLRDLGAQRHRWASGNLRTLIVHLPGLRPWSDALAWSQSCAVVAQLSAWIDFSLVPAAVLLSCLIFAPSAPPVVLTLAAISLLVTLVDIVSRLGLRAAYDGRPLRCLLGALASRLALSPASARATVEAVLPVTLRFVVTAKGALRATGDRPTDHLVLFVLTLMAAPGALSAGPLVQLSWLALLLPLPAALLTGAELTRYRSYLQEQEMPI